MSKRPSEHTGSTDHTHAAYKNARADGETEAETDLANAETKHASGATARQPDVQRGEDVRDGEEDGRMAEQVAGAHPARSSVSPCRGGRERGSEAEGS